LPAKYGANAGANNKNPTIKLTAHKIKTWTADLIKSLINFETMFSELLLFIIESISKKKNKQTWKIPKEYLHVNLHLIE
jgi:hypothetical protein